MKRRKRVSDTLLVSVRIITSMTAVLIGSQVGANADNYKAPHVRNQLTFMKHHGQPLGFFPGVSTPAVVRLGHYQGIARMSDQNGIPYIFISHSTPPNEGGEIAIVRMGSRDRTGERLRSNRRVRGTNTPDTPPPWSDRGMEVIPFSESQYGYWHPGGMQIIDGVLAVAVMGHLPDDCGECPRGIILLFDVKDPVNPKLLYRYNLWSDSLTVEGTGAVAIAKREDRSADNGKYILAVLVKTAQDNADWLYVLQSTTTDLRAPNMQLIEIDRWNSVELGDEENMWKGGVNADPLNYPAFQSLNFVKQERITGEVNPRLYLLCGYNSYGSPASGSDYMYLFEAWFNEVREFKLDYIMQKHLFRDDGNLNLGAGGAGQYADFGAAGGAYVSPSGQLMLYSSEYSNGGPGGSVRFGEYHHRDVVIGGQPETGPWADFYIDENGWTDEDESRSLVLDAMDEHLDNWENLHIHEKTGDEIEALRTYVASGWSLHLWEHQMYGRRHTIRGPWLDALNLDAVHWDSDPNDGPNREVSGVQFIPVQCADEVLNVPETVATISGAVDLAWWGDCTVISIRPGVYVDTFTIDQPMTLVTRGRGVVRIGR